ncbi:hypothetical protein F4813DRAFT_394952 [Daldinia decipiens]|uniref:uncharacterized protein n=1 Tax=Daldinia decipiens TaxID=326647 RepID=UPI0020C4FCCA|nr:uncharacterized protein F4813DRAFT_394952 [Daldinia decipiens]KAI1662835.1 hypothetical protein F4813DRAFT_394952 [Daldinia decipiens]
MPTKYVPPLSALIPKALFGGLAWKTQPKDVLDENMYIYENKCRLLLYHPHSFHIAKVLFKGLRSKSPTLIGLALSHVYEFAAEKVELCSFLELVEFFAYVKDSYDWSSRFSDKAFWAFTYKAFHARQIFLNTVMNPDREDPTVLPLARSLDLFRDAFLKMYPIDPTMIREEGDKICQENIELVEDMVYLNKEIYNKYFPYHLTHHDGQGDGTDKIVLFEESKKKNSNETANPSMLKHEEVDMSKIPDEELFFYDTECKTKHHDAFQHVLDTKGKIGLKSKGLPKRTESMKGAGSVRKYDTFKDYRETGNADDVDDTAEPDPSNEGTNIVDNDDDDGDGDGDGMPNMKKLKIEDDKAAVYKDGDEGVPDIKNLHLVDDEESSDP